MKDIPGNDLFEIDRAGNIASKDGKACTPSVVDGKIKIEMYGKEVTVLPQWLGMVAAYELDLPEAFRDEFWQVRFDSGRLCLPRPIEIIKGFRLVWRYPAYCVNQEGRVVEWRTGKELTQHLLMSARDKRILMRGGSPHRGYFRVSLWDPIRGAIGEITTVGVNRIVAFAWVDNQDPSRFDVVNHIDGNTHNNRAENLEWVNSRSNNVHASVSGLRGDTIPCRVRDFDTGEVKRFESVKEACRFMGLSPDTKAEMISYVRPAKLILDRYEFRLFNDERPWHYEGKTQKEVAGRFTIRVTMPDGSKRIYLTSTHFKRELKLWNVGCGLPRLISKARATYPGIIVEVEDFYDQRALQGFDISTGKIVEFPSIREAARSTGVDFGKVRHRVKTEKRFRADGWFFRYKKDEPWDPLSEEVAYTYRPVCIRAEHVRDGKVAVYRSYREAERSFGIVRETLRRHVDSNKPIAGWLLSTIQQEPKRIGDS